MTRQPYLDAVAERVIVYDGAFGTFIQDLDLGPDDFGGHALEGCNEMLCLTRPDVIRAMHEAFFDVGVDALETASFGSFSPVLNEYAVADKAYELGQAMAKSAAYGILGKKAPAFVVAPAITITKANLVKGYHDSLHRAPPKSVLNALKK